MYCPLYTAGRRKHLNASGRPRKPPSTFQPSDARSLAAMFFRENWCLRDAAHGVGAEMSGIMGIYLETRSGCHARHTTTIVHYTLLPLMILIESTTSTGLSGTETVRCAVRRGSVWICAAHTDHFVCAGHVHTDNDPHIQTTLYVRRTYRPHIRSICTHSILYLPHSPPVYPAYIICTHSSYALHLPRADPENLKKI